MKLTKVAIVVVTLALISLFGNLAEATPAAKVKDTSAVVFIMQHEGFRATPYLDAAGLYSIGYGHLILPGEHFHKINQQQARDLLVRDMGKAHNAIDELVRVPLTDNQRTALTSFTFNLGGGALAKSTLLKKLNKGDYNVGREFAKWNKVNGKAHKGLTARRKAEADLFNS